MEKKLSVKEYASLFLNRNFVIIILIAVANGFASRLCTAPLTSHGMAIAGMTGTLIGISITVNKIVSMLGRPVSGASFDMVGCKKTLMLAFISKGIAYIFLSFTNSVFMWFIGKALEGFANAILGGLIVATAISIVGAQGRGLAISCMSAFPALVQGMAPVVSKAIFTATSYSTALLIGGISMVVPTILCIFLDEKAIQITKIGGKTAEKSAAKLPWYKKLASGIMLAVLPVCTMGLFANVAKDLNTNYIVQLGEVTGIDVTGGIAIAGFVSFLLAIVIGIVIDIVGNTVVLYLGYVLLAASNLLYGYGTSQQAYTMAALCFAIGIAAYWPALQAYVFKVAGPGRQGAASATLYLFLDVVAVIFGTLTGVFYDLVGLQNVFKLVGAIVIGAIIYFTILKIVWLDKYVARREKELETN